jgi:hypothetical protein
MLLVSAAIATAEVRIHELLASNGATVVDEDGDYSDWIELRNSGSAAVNLAGWGLSDSPGSPMKWVFPDSMVIGAGTHVLVWASGKNRRHPSGPLHTSFSLAASGETVVLTAPGGTLVDSVSYPALPRDLSYGRLQSGGAGWFFFEQPTPGSANTTNGYANLMTPPEFSHSGGFHTTPFNLNVEAGNPNWTIYYTLDGSEPDPARVGSGARTNRVTRLWTGTLQVGSRQGSPNVFSQIPTTALIWGWQQQWVPPAGEVFKATVVRAVAYDPASGRLSKPVTRSFLVDPGIHNRYGNLPVVSLVSDHVHLFDNASGIYVPGTTHDGSNPRTQNPFRGWEKPASIEFFEGGQLAFGGDIGIRNQGSTTPAAMQKGLHVIAREEQGSESIPHRLFPNGKSPAGAQTDFKRFVIRAWGSARHWEAIFTDAYHQQLAATSDLEIQEYRPAVVFINGEYWGLHELREASKNSWYHQARTGIDRNDPGFDLLDYAGQIIDEGDAVHWNETVAYINSNNPATDAFYNHVAGRVDLKNFAEYIIHCVFTGKRDWPTQNEAMWRPRTVDGRWRWTQYDMDHGLSDWGKPEYDMLQHAMVGPSLGPHPMLTRLIQNPKFRRLFINTYADWLNTRFKSSVALELFDAMKSELDPFIPEFANRWPGSFTWTTGTAAARSMVERRRGLRLEQLRSRFNLGANRTVILKADPAKGLIRCNATLVDENTPGTSAGVYPWSGTYFQNQPIDLTAVPRPGHRFLGWRLKIGTVTQPGTPVYYSQQATIDLTLGTNAAYEAEAVFEVLPPPPQPIVIHRWDFGTAANPLQPNLTVGGASFAVSGAATAAWVEAAAQGFPTAHLRVNNPLQQSLVWTMPTTGFSDVELSFLTRRSGSGAGTQRLSVRVNGSTWSELETYAVADADPVLKTIDLSGIPGINHNPSFAVKVEFFQGEGGNSGNNRFDQVTLRGVPLAGTVGPPVPTGTLPDLLLVAGNGPETVDLSRFFESSNGEAIQFGVASSSPVLETGVSGGLLDLSAAAAGEALVTVTAQVSELVNAIAEFRVTAVPEPFPLASGVFRFSEWSPEQPAGSYPAHMVFLQSTVSDPVRTTPLEMFYSIPAEDAASPADISFPYKATSRSRINGLGEAGISFINTGRDRDVGAAVLALDTTGQQRVELRWTVQTRTVGRPYGLCLQYRLSTHEEWSDFPALGTPVDYFSSLVAGHQQHYGPVRLPEMMENRPNLQLRWRYHYLSGTSGPRASIRLDDVMAYSATTYQEWVAQHFSSGAAGNPMVSGPGVDLNGDGRTNLLRYALGIAPSDPGMRNRYTAGVAADGGLQARFFLDPRRSDVVYRIETSADLSDWSETVFESLSHLQPNSHGVMHEVRVPPGTSKRFIRLAISPP